MNVNMWIADDLLQVLTDRAQRKGMSVDDLANQILREWLDRSENPSEAKQSAYDEKTFNLGRPLVDLTKALQLSAEMEDEEIIEKLRRS